MRSKDRIDPFLDQLGEIWKNNFVDWRFGQLMTNFFGWMYSEKKIDGFFPEEGKMIELFKEYSKENSKW